MYKNILKKGASLLAVALVGITCFTSCIEDPDETQPFGSDDQTIFQLISARADLAAFNSLLAKSGYDKVVSTYQTYTCFAPTNQGVNDYIDSLYDDNNKKFPHNGIAETPNFKSLDIDTKISLLSDSLAKNLVMYHITGEPLQQMNMEQSMSTLLDRKITPSVVTADNAPNMPHLLGKISLNSITEAKMKNGQIEKDKNGKEIYMIKSVGAIIVEGDIKATNGYVHIIDKMLPRTDRTTDDQLNASGKFGIFYEALLRTGLDKELQKEKKNQEFKYYQTKPTDRENPKHQLYCPEECLIKYTVFAESDDVFRSNGIHNFDELKAHCVDWYQNCALWYDYVKEHNIQISTGNDYQNPWNVVHMFMAYHILRAGMPVDEIVYEKNNKTSSTWNMCFGYEPQEYFETMLPNTLMKIWETDPKGLKDLWINRWRLNNTLTDQIGTFGSNSKHPIQKGEGLNVKINRNASVETLNGYIHSIEGILLYNDNVVKSQSERMRFDSSTFLYELINNGIRFATAGDIGKKNLRQNGVDEGNRVAFDNTYFDNIVCYNPNTLLRFCVMGAWRANNSDQFQGWDSYDFAIKLPHVPTGQYELRIIYPPMGRGGLMQFYLGNSSNQADMKAQGIPFDACADPTQPGNVMGCEEIVAASDEVESDYGVESDQNMHVRGYMRAPASFSRATYNSITDKLQYNPVDEDDIYCAAKSIVGGTSCRSEWGYGTMMLRRIICTQTFEQGKDYWLRIKNLVNNENLGWSFDFIELCPLNVANATDMKEDWY